MRGTRLAGTRFGVEADAVDSRKTLAPQLKQYELSAGILTPQTGQNLCAIILQYRREQKIIGS